METKGFTVMVLGCGTMGSGIATTFLIPGTTLIVVENNFSMFSNLNLSLTPSHHTALKERGHAWVTPKILLLGSLDGWEKDFPVPLLVVEAIPEKMEMKKKIFNKLEVLFGGRAILGSNTSTLPLPEMAIELKYPHRFLGMHYNHPAHIIPIVEVTKLEQTSEESVRVVVELLKKCGKIPVMLNKPIDGFITNRLQHALYREIYSLMEDGSVGPEDVDNVAKYMFGPRMCVTGLLLQKDCSGLDTHTFSQRQMVKVLANNTTCGRVLEEKFSKGEFGLKSGKGFYNWKTEQPSKVQKDVNNRLIQVYNFLEKNNVMYNPPKASL